MNVHILEPHGVCGGVARAIEIAKKTKKKYPDVTITILGDLVHNETIVHQIEELGIVSLHCPCEDQKKCLEQISSGVVIFTAHGHDLSLDKIAQEKGLIAIDATCPHVQKNMDTIRKIINKGYVVFFIGLKHHPEAHSACSVSPYVYLIDPNHIDIPEITLPIHIVVQTTLSMKEKSACIQKILSKYPTSIIENEVCKATEIRQNALYNIPSQSDCVIIVGGNHSSNTENLRKITCALYPNKKVVKIASKNDITTAFKDFTYITLVGGASTLSSDLYDIKEALLKL